jgi:hypothetical protein
VQVKKWCKLVRGIKAKRHKTGGHETTAECIATDAWENSGTSIFRVVQEILLISEIWPKTVKTVLYTS